MPKCWKVYFLFEKVTLLHIFLAQNLGQNRPTPLKLKRSRRELYGPAGWFVLFCFGSTNACFVLRAAPTARFVLVNKTLF